MPSYFFGQGKAFLFPIDPITKFPLSDGYWVGNVATGGLTVTLQTESYEHKETYTGDRLTDLKIETGKTLGGTIQFEEWSLKNLQTVLYGKGASVTGASVTAESHVANEGGIILLDNINVTTFTSLTRTGGTPVLVPGTDYKVDKKGGTIEIIEGGSIADGDTVIANYSFAGHENVTAFSSTNVDYWLRFNGLNTADDNSPVVVDICRTRLLPPTNLNLISDEMAMLECEFGGLYVQELDVAGGPFEGGFMRIRKV